MTDRLAEIRALLAGATPGTWETGHDGPDEVDVWVGPVDTATTLVATCRRGDAISANRFEADARLIAAAPELLRGAVETIDALERGLSAATDGMNEQAREIERLREAVAAADRALYAPASSTARISEARRALRPGQPVEELT